jgi:zinc/manganese transport system substrate-binding protein
MRSDEGTNGAPVRRIKVMKGIMSSISLVLFALALGSAPAGAEPLRVVASIETLADLARRVGGEKVAVESLSHGYQDPHFVEAKPNLMVTLNRADILLRVGLDLEIGWLPPLVQGSRNDKIQLGQAGDVDCSTFIDVIDIPAVKVTRAMGDMHPLGNPHYWIPPVHALRIARGIADRFKRVRPNDAGYFEQQLDKLLADLKARARGWDDTAKTLAGMNIVTYHKSWSYVSSWLKLEEVGYIENKPGIPPSPSHLAELIALMRAKNVRVILVEDFYNRAIAEDVGEKSGARVLAMPSDVGAKPDIKTYFDLVDADLRILATARATGAVKP